MPPNDPLRVSDGWSKTARELLDRLAKAQPPSILHQQLVILGDMAALLRCMTDEAALSDAAPQVGGEADLRAYMADRYLNCTAPSPAAPDGGEKKYWTLPEVRFNRWRKQDPEGTVEDAFEGGYQMGQAVERAKSALTPAPVDAVRGLVKQWRADVAACTGRSCAGCIAWTCAADQLEQALAALPVAINPSETFSKSIDALPVVRDEGRSSVRTSMLHHWLRELNRARQCESPAGDICEYLHKSILAHLDNAAPPVAQERGQADDTARLDYIERTFSGMTSRERYLPVQMIWGKGANGRTLREACDKYMARDRLAAASAEVTPGA